MIKSNKLVLHFIIPLEVRYSIYLQNYAWHVCSNLSHTRGRLTLSREVLETITLGRDSVCRWQRLQNWGGGAWERFHLRTRQKYLATKSFRIYWLRCIYNLKQLLFTRWSVCVCVGEEGSTKNAISFDILIGQTFLPEQVITESFVVHYHFLSLG